MNYLEMFNKSLVKSPKTVQNRSNLILFYQPLYAAAAQAAGIPWQIIGCIHSLEAGCLMTRHLHNGDPLKARTVRVPAGRPKAAPASGQFPYTWLESAIDALKDRKPPETKDLNGWLEFCENYNGLGYRRRGLPSPYIWSFTDAYEKGYYKSDGVFDPELVSQNIGVVALLKSMGTTKL